MIRLRLCRLCWLCWARLELESLLLTSVSVSICITTLPHPLLIRLLILSLGLRRWLHLCRLAIHSKQIRFTLFYFVIIVVEEVNYRFFLYLLLGLWNCLSLSLALRRSALFLFWGGVLPDRGRLCYLCWTDLLLFWLIVSRPPDVSLLLAMELALPFSFLSHLSLIWFNIPEGISSSLEVILCIASIWITALYASSTAPTKGCWGTVIFTTTEPSWI